VFAKIKVLKQLLRSVLQAVANIWGIIFPTIKLNTRVSSMVLITLMSMESSAVKYIFGEIRIVINQMEGRFNVDSSNIIPYYNEAKISLESIYCDSYYFVHIHGMKTGRLIHSPTKPSMIDLLTFESNYLEGGAFIC
jgi:hypothetical protein